MSTMRVVQSKYFILASRGRALVRGEAGISGGLEHGFLDGSVVEPGDGDRPRDAAAMELRRWDGCQDEEDAVKKASQKTRTTTRFGARLREKRLEKQITLRKFADMIGVSSTYLSQVEQGRYDPPTADRVRQIAEILGEDADLWIGLADRVPEDMEEIVKEHPKEMPELLRAARGLTPEQFEKLQQTIKRMKTKG